MSAPRDLDRLLQSFLTDGPLELPDASYDEVRSRMDQQRQRAFIGSWRTPDMNRYLKIGLAAAAVLVIAVVAFNLLPGSAAPGGEPSATPEPTATPAAPSAAPSEAADLPLGPYALTTADGQWTVAMTVTIGAPGWIGNDSQGILTKNDNPDPPDGAGLIVFTGQLEVYGDPCRWATTRPDPMTGATVDEVIAALTAQVGRNATEPVDVTVDEYSGKSITLSVPTDANFANCDAGEFRSWGPENVSRYHQGPGQIDQVWVVDVDGTLVTIDGTWYDGTPAGDRAELDAILGSMQFGTP